MTCHESFMGFVQLVHSSLQASGAYIFRPNGTSPFPINPGNIATVTVVKVTASLPVLSGVNV